MKKLSLWLSPAASFVTMALTAGKVFAEEISINAPGEFGNLTNITAGSMVSALIRLVLIVAALLFFFMLVIGGIQWMISGGDKAASENARKRITSALVGLAIVFVAWAIINLVNAMFGVNILTLNIPNFLNK